MRNLTTAAILLGSMATHSIAQTCLPPDNDWHKTHDNIKPLPIPVPTFPKWDDDFWRPRPWDREFPPEFPIRKSPILLSSVELIVAKQDGPARNYARLEGKTYFKGEWGATYILKNTHSSRSLKVKVRRLDSSGAWPKFEPVVYVLAPNESEDLGSIGQSFKAFAPVIEGAWYSDEVGG